MTDMKIYLIFLAGLLIGLLCFPIVARVIATPHPTYIIFSPDNGDQIIELIKSSKSTLDIDTYALTSQKVIDAIVEAKERGVLVRVIMEKNVLDDQNDKSYSKLKAKGIQVVYKNKKGSLNHIKIIIIDGKKVVVGSHNLTESALFKNREASVVLDDFITVEYFREMFERDWME